MIKSFHNVGVLSKICKESEWNFSVSDNYNDVNIEKLVMAVTMRLKNVQDCDVDVSNVQW